MDEKVTVTMIDGDTLAVVLPRAVVERLGLHPGDTLFLQDIPDGVTLTRDDPELARQMADATRAMDEDRDALGRLAQ